MTALITRDRIDGSKADTANGVNVANFLAGTGNAWDCLQTLGIGLTAIAAGVAVLTQANAGLCLVDASAGNVTITLPACSAAIGALFQFKRTDNTANAVTISRAGADTIDGATSASLVGQYDFVEMRSDGSSIWRGLNVLANLARARSLLGAAAIDALTIYPTAGTNTAYTITPSPAIAAYAIGQSFFVNFNAASGASPTLAISGLATPPQLVKENADGTYSNIAAGDIPINHRSRVTLISTTQALVEKMSPVFSMVRVNTANGSGSPNTAIRRFTTVVASQGAGITYADSATLGGTFTINTAGVYAISYSDSFSAGSAMGISVNSTQLSTAINSIAIADRLMDVSTAGADQMAEASSTVYLAAGSIARAHASGNTNGSFPARTQFTITQVA